jgi:hypothetical protein
MIDSSHSPCNSDAKENIYCIASSDISNRGIGKLVLNCRNFACEGICNKNTLFVNDVAIIGGKDNTKHNAEASFFSVLSSYLRLRLGKLSLLKRQYLK